MERNGEMAPTHTSGTIGPSVLFSIHFLQTPALLFTVLTVTMHCTDSKCLLRLQDLFLNGNIQFKVHPSASTSGSFPPPHALPWLYQRLTPVQCLMSHLYYCEWFSTPATITISFYASLPTSFMHTLNIWFHSLKKQPHFQVISKLCSTQSKF